MRAGVAGIKTPLRPPGRCSRWALGTLVPPVQLLFSVARSTSSAQLRHARPATGGMTRASLVRESAASTVHNPYRTAVAASRPVHPSLSGTGRSRGNSGRSPSVLPSRPCAASTSRPAASSGPVPPATQAPRRARTGRAGGYSGKLGTARGGQASGRLRNPNGRRAAPTARAVQPSPCPGVGSHSRGGSAEVSSRTLWSAPSPRYSGSATQSSARGAGRIIAPRTARRPARRRRPPRRGAASAANHSGRRDTASHPCRDRRP